MDQEDLGCGAEKLKIYKYCARFTVADIAGQAVISSAAIVHTGAVFGTNLVVITVLEAHTFTVAD